MSILKIRLLAPQTPAFPTTSVIYSYRPPVIIMLPDAQQSFTLGVASLAAIKFVHDVTGHSATPLTGHQYAKAGGEHLDQTLAILNGPRGEIMNDRERFGYLRKSDNLVPTRQRLEIETRTYTGSFRHRKGAKKFHDEAENLHNNTLSSSHKAEIEKSMREINERAQAEVQERARQVQAPPMAYPDHPQSRPSHANVYQQYPSNSSQTQAYPQNQSNQAQAIAYPGQYQSNQSPVYPLSPSYYQGPGHPQYSSGQGSSYPPAGYNGTSSYSSRR